MSSSTHHSPDNLSLLDLFRSEVRTNGKIVRDGLLKIIEGLDVDAGLDSLGKSLNTILGGARIVELNDIASLAGGIQECLLSCQEKSIQLIPKTAGLLLDALDMILEMARVESQDLADWFAKNHDRIQGKIAEIENAPFQTSPPISPPPDLNAEDAGESLSAHLADPGSGSTQNQEAATSRKDEITGNFSITADDTMLDLYLQEVKTHTETLNNGLLELENHHEDSVQLESLMRSAHSLKGGARVIRLDMAVDCAHAMEDCFVAAQNGQITLSSGDIDILLQGVDMLQALAEAGRDRDAHFLDELKKKNIILVQSIQGICGVSPPAGQTPQREVSGSGSGEPVDSVSLQKHAPDSHRAEGCEPLLPISLDREKRPNIVGNGTTRAIRVSAKKIERLMGLAGEVVVGASWLTPFSHSLLDLKRSHAELYDILSQLYEMSRAGNWTEEEKMVLEQAREKNKTSIQTLADRMNHLEKFTSSYETLSDTIYNEVISVRMRPFSDGVQKFPRLVRDLARQLNKKIQFEIRGNNTEVDRDILEKLDAPLTHLIQNAVDHGIETPEERRAAGKPESGQIVLQASHLSGMLIVTISDNGRGIDLDDLRKKIVLRQMASEQMIEKMNEYELLDFLFLPGFSTKGNVTQISGRGVGLDVVQSMVREVGGMVRAQSRAGDGLTFILELPLTLSVLRTFLVKIKTELYAFPLARIDRCLALHKKHIEIVEDREYFHFDGNNIALVDVRDILGIKKTKKRSDEIMVLVVSDRLHAYGLVVDQFLGETDLVQRPLDSRLGKVPNIDSAAIMLDGSPVLIIDVEDMVHSIGKLLDVRGLKKIGICNDSDKKVKKRILVVDDSITVREMERKILTNLGFDVEVAVDGVEGWNIVRSDHFDLIVSDIDMPRMNGFEFVTLLKSHEEFRSIPVIIMSYKDREEDRMRGLEAGASHYLSKSSFDDNSFMDAVIDLLIEP